MRKEHARTRTVRKHSRVGHLWVAEEPSMDHKCSLLNQCTKWEQDKSFADVVKQSLSCVAILSCGILINDLVWEAIGATDVNVLVISTVKEHIPWKHYFEREENHDHLPQGRGIKRAGRLWTEGEIHFDPKFTPIHKVPVKDVPEQEKGPNIIKRHDTNKCIIITDPSAFSLSCVRNEIENAPIARQINPLWTLNSSPERIDHLLNIIFNLISSFGGGGDAPCSELGENIACNIIFMPCNETCHPVRQCMDSICKERIERCGLSKTFDALIGSERLLRSCWLHSRGVKIKKKVLDNYSLTHVEGVLLCFIILYNITLYSFIHFFFIYLLGTGKIILL